MTKLDKTATPSKRDLLRVGELAKAVGKTVRAIHLYEELDLVKPTMRTGGNFRLYDKDAVARIGWIIKLQAIGFTLSEIQGFVREFEQANSGREATAQAREVFGAKLVQIRDQITQLSVIENDLEEALDYLDACDACSPEFAPVECKACGHNGHERGDAPPLFVGLSETAPSRPSDRDASGGQFDVAVAELRKQGTH